LRLNVWIAARSATIARSAIRRIVPGLQVHPESDGRTEELRQAERCVGRDPKLLADNALDARARDATRLCDLVGREIHGLQELLAQHLARVHRG